jgi:hypothetical protein
MLSGQRLHFDQKNRFTGQKNTWLREVTLELRVNSFWRLHIDKFPEAAVEWQPEHSVFL